MLPLDVAPKLSIATYQYWLLLRLTLLLPKKILQAQLLKLLSSRTKSFTLQFSVNQRSLSTPSDSGVEGGVVYSLCVRVCLGVGEVNVCAVSYTHLTLPTRSTV